MDGQTMIILEKLAEKLGTTVEHLWGVLVNQAPISAAVDMLITIILWVLAVLWLRKVRENTKKNEDGYKEWDYEPAGFAWICVFALFVISFMVTVSSLPLIVAGFANPEYWALKQLIK